MMMRHANPVVVAVAIATTFALGCKEEATPITPAEAEQYVETWAPTVEQTLTERTEGASIARELKTVIDAAAAKEEGASQRNEPPYGIFVKDVYAEFEYQPHLVQHGKLTPAGEAIWTNIQTVADHALDPEPYHLVEISAAIEKLEKVAPEVNTDDLHPTDSERKFASDWLLKKSQEDFPLTEENYVALTDALLESSKSARLKEVMKGYEELGGKLAADSARLEQMLARDWVKFSRDVGNRHVREMFIHPRHDDYYNDPEIRKQNERNGADLASYKAGVMWRKAARVAESMKNHTGTLHQRIRASLRDVMTSDQPEKVAASVWPAQPEYKGLISEYKRYRAITDAGGWKEVPQKKRLKVGSRDKVVKQLKERLQIEGYYPQDAELDTRYDEELAEAVRAYQRTHQMEVTGVPHRTFWRSLNVPAESRTEQIALNLARWRVSNIRHDEDETYVYINVPDFHAELWDKGERQMRFGIVVGNNDLVEDEETGDKERANRTPVPIAAYIDRAIYNPYWNVTPRVRTNEILPEVKEWVEARYRRKKAAEDDKYAALRAALSGNTSPATDSQTGSAIGSANPDPTLTNTVGDPTGSPTGATNTEDAPPTQDTEEEEVKPFRLEPGSFDLASFPYVNPETGEVDVSTTIPDNIPGWYAENDYEVMHAGKKWEYVRMTPGDHNALGLVKVIFPNYHDVYLHDTNAKPLFQRDIRAFSHGCMRMAQPLDFAEYLLRRDGVYEEHDIPEILKEGTYLPVFLKRQVPVFVEYRTVRVDSDGRANFLADIYDYDEEGVVLPKLDKTQKPVAP